MMRFCNPICCMMHPSTPSTHSLPHRHTWFNRDEFQQSAGRKTVITDTPYLLFMVQCAVAIDCYGQFRLWQWGHCTPARSMRTEAQLIVAVCRNTLSSQWQLGRDEGGMPVHRPGGACIVCVCVCVCVCVRARWNTDWESCGRDTECRFSMVGEQIKVDMMWKGLFWGPNSKPTHLWYETETCVVPTGWQLTPTTLHPSRYQIVWYRGGPTVVVSLFAISNFAATSQNLDYTQVSDKPFLYALYLCRYHIRIIPVM